MHSSSKKAQSLDQGEIPAQALGRPTLILDSHPPPGLLDMSVL